MELSKCVFEFLDIITLMSSFFEKNFSEKEDFFIVVSKCISKAVICQ